MGRPSPWPVPRSAPREAKTPSPGPTAPSRRPSPLPRLLCLPILAQAFASAFAYDQDSGPRIQALPPRLESVGEWGGRGYGPGHGEGREEAGYGPPRDQRQPRPAYERPPQRRPAQPYAHGYGPRDSYRQPSDPRDQPPPSQHSRYPDDSHEAPPYQHRDGRGQDESEEHRGSWESDPPYRSSHGQARDETVEEENSVEGLPMVTCGSEEMGIVVNTRLPFLGRIFVKGQSKREECVREFLKNSVPEGGLRLPLSTCGMRRERKLSPYPGLQESIVVVVSFHYVFVTANDRAYKVLCAYNQEPPRVESMAVVTHGLNVSQIRAEEVTPAAEAKEPPRAPECSYEIRRGGFQGPYALYAEVGDVLFHRWSCDGEPGLRFLVKSCLVSDGSGEIFVVVDDRGCSVDSRVLPQLHYSDQDAWVQARAFKFPDTSFLGFSCSIQVCWSSEEGSCEELSPPACGVEGPYPDIPVHQRGHALRSLADEPLPVPANASLPSPAPLLGDEVDVSAPSLNILDSRLLASAPLSPDLRKGPPQHLHDDAFLPRGRLALDRRSTTEDAICLSPVHVGIVSLLGGSLLLALLLTLVYVFFYHPRKSLRPANSPEF